MNYKISVGSTSSNQEIVKNYLTEKNFKSILDVGGCAANWSSSFSTHYLDLRSHISDTNKKHFRGDICQPDGWKEVEDYVKENGKFDFCICSHTIEDVINPKFVCDKISMCANEGVILVPSKYKELHKHEHSLSPDRHGNSYGSNLQSESLASHVGKFYRGYGHHFWYLSVNEHEQLYAMPKLGFIEVDPYYDAIGDPDQGISDICVFWRESIGFKMIIPSIECDNMQQEFAYCRMYMTNDALDRSVGRKFLVTHEMNDQAGRMIGTTCYQSLNSHSAMPPQFRYFGTVRLHRDDNETLMNFINSNGRFPSATDSLSGKT